jgi:hypothetical protein
MSETTTTLRLSQYDQAETVEAKVQILNKYLDLAEADRNTKGLPDRWKKNKILYEPEKNPTEPTGEPFLKANMSYSNIETIMQELVDNWLKINILPGNNDSIKIKDILQLRHDEFLDDSKFFLNAIKNIRQGLIIDHSIMQMTYSLDRDTGLISGNYSVVDPMTFLPAVNWKGLDVFGKNGSDGDATFIGFRYPTPIDNILNLYPEEANGLNLQKSDTQKYYLNEVQNSDDIIKNEIYFVSTFNPKSKARVAPYLRKIFYITNPAVILLDTPQFNNRAPYFLFAPGAQANEGRGIAMTNLIKTIQETAGVIYSKIAEAVKRQPVGSPWAKTDCLNMQADFMAKVTNGKVIEVDSEGDFGFKPAPEVSVSSVNFIQSLHDLNRFVTRIQEVMQGKEQYANMPMGAILALQRASRGVIRLLSEESLVPMFEDMGKFNIALFQKLETGTMEILQQEGLSMKGIKYNAAEIKKKKFKVSVVAGGGMPRDPALREARASANLADGSYTKKRKIMNMVDPNTQELIDEADQADRTKQYEQLMEQENMAEQALTTIVQKMLVVMNVGRSADGYKVMVDPNNLKEPNLSRYKILEEQAAEILDQFPHLYKSGAFLNLPKAVQQQLVRILVKPADQPGAQAQPGEKK